MSHNHHQQHNIIYYKLYQHSTVYTLFPRTCKATLMMSSLGLHHPGHTSLATLGELIVIRFVPRCSPGEHDVVALRTPR